MTKQKMTGSGTHIATERGYAAGELIEPGQPVPADVPVGSWMERADGKVDAADRAIEDAQKPLPDDPDLTQLSTQALQAMATERGVTSVKGLSKNDLIDAIKAAHDPKR